MFTDVEQCLGNVAADWSWQYDGVASNVTLSSGGTAVTSMPTPLKVTHAANCGQVAPTLSLQHDTEVLGTLTVGGIDVAAALTSLGLSPSGRRLQAAQRDNSQGSPSTASPNPTLVGQHGGILEAAIPVTRKAVGVAASGETRRLSAAPSCCRWTSSDSCSPIGEACTALHEYIEQKTTTHEFVDVSQCLGSDSNAWSFQYDGATSNVTLSSAGAPVAAWPTPIKVTHAAACSSAAPTLSLQLNTVALGSLSVGGFDIAAALTSLLTASPREP